ncbi:MAG: diacylglycerol kinase (ATP) [Candidatus Marinamargulisbacteria bacterium]|jgi:diacylglycerol kinase (ATP)
MLFHGAFTIFAIGLGCFFKISTLEWIALSFAITLVFVTELINTAIEFTIDLYTREKKMLAMLSKDTAAGAVLVASINALIIGYLLFYHRLATLIHGG